MFDGCVYVTNRNSVLVPGGELLKPENFKGKHGGHTFVITPDNSKVTRDAFEAFVHSQVLVSPRADDVIFRPDLRPMEIIVEGEGPGARTYVNQWWPPYIHRAKGNIEFWNDLLRRMIPDDLDRAILEYGRSEEHTSELQSPLNLV